MFFSTLSQKNWLGSKVEKYSSRILKSWTVHFVHKQQMIGLESIVGIDSSNIVLSGRPKIATAKTFSIKSKF